jgi:hypothetical protein
MRVTKVRDYSKRGDALPVPDLIEVQTAAYERFLQLDKGEEERDLTLGLESLLREVFPIESYDGSMKLEYLYYKLDEARYTPDECSELRLTYGMPFRIGVRLVRQDGENWARFEVHHDGSGLRAVGARTVDGRTRTQFSVPVELGGAVWMRLARVGSGWSLSVSDDGSSWSVVGSFSHGLQVTEVGPFVGNFHSSASQSPALTAGTSPGDRSSASSARPGTPWEPRPTTTSSTTLAGDRP